MDVVLIRHATAVDETLALHDPMRMLSAVGRTQARRLGDGLRGHGIVATHVWTSPLVRAVQTAELVAAALGSACPVDVAPLLAPDESVRGLIAALHALHASSIVLVVGHEPNLSALGALLTNAHDFPAIAKAEAACVSNHEPTWRLAWDGVVATSEA